MRTTFAVAALVASAAPARSSLPTAEAAQAAAKAFIAATSGFRGIVRPESAPPPRAPTPTLGVAFAITPAGAEVIAIMPRSPAAAAGLRPGALVTSVNGSALAGLSPDAVAAALRPPTVKVVYGLAGGAEVSLTRTAPSEQAVTVNAEAD